VISTRTRVITTHSVIMTSMSVIMTLTSVIRPRTNVISTHTRLIPTRIVQFPHAECDFTRFLHTRVILTPFRVNMTFTSVITTRSSVIPLHKV
jgi:hypothetical protein